MFKLAALVSAVLATSVLAVPTMVVNPKITLPSAGMAWPIGTEQNVTWEY